MEAKWGNVDKYVNKSPFLWISGVSDNEQHPALYAVCIMSTLQNESQVKTFTSGILIICREGLDSIIG